AYTRTRVWNFSDDCGNVSADFTQTISVIDTTVPVIATASGSLDATIECSNAQDISDALALEPSATDNCGSVTLNLVSDTTTNDPNCATAYTRIRVWNFSDDCGNVSADFTQTISVIDTTASVIATASGSLDATIECSNTQDISDALA